MTKFRIREIRTRVPKRVMSRRDLPPFGDAKVSNEGVTLLSKDFVGMEHPDDQLVEDTEDPSIKNTLADFIRKTQERSVAREIDDEQAELVDDDKAGDKGGDGKSKYVAPGARSGISPRGSSLESMSVDAQAANTLRVSNLTKEVTQDDLRELFEPFGRVLRVSLPMIEKTEGGRTIKEPRGFAYIAFNRKEDAERALERLQGHGYGHLILKLEWAKPTKDGPGGPPSGGGLSGGYVSGYGKQLAQDTKEKVLYASNLTGNR